MAVTSTPAPYRVAVVGTGGVGGYLAARLANTPGIEVHCICRGAHKEAIQRWGIRVTSIGGDTTALVASATDTPADVGVVDLIIVALKTWQMEGLQLQPLVGPRTLVMPTQNGVDTPTVLGTLLGPKHVLGGYSRITSLLTGPGEVRHTAIQPAIQGTGLLASSGAWAAKELERAAEAWGRCPQLQLRVEPDINLAMWQKLTTMAPYSALCASSRCCLGPLLAAPATRDLMLACMHETAAVARACGAEITDVHIRNGFATLEGLPAGATPSLMRDFTAGRPSELDAQVGCVVRLAAEKGVPAPMMGALYAVLLPQEAIARGQMALPKTMHCHADTSALPLEYNL